MKKRERYLSLILAPHHNSRPWQIDISYSRLRRLAILGGILVAVLLLLAANYGRVLWRATQYEVIKKRSAEIEANFAKIEKLKAELSQIRQTEEKLKEILGVARQPAMLTVGDISRSQTLTATNFGEEQIPDTSEARQIIGGTSTPSLMPVKGWLSARMTENHHGVDIAAREGAPVMAAADGVVTFAGWDEYFGNQIKISHGQKFSTMYGHNAKLFVKPGQRVLQGQIIALVGSTGRSSGPHLHYEIRINGKPADPTYFWMHQ